MKLALIAVALLVVGCDEPKYQCSETACRPDWSGDCYCNSSQYMERQSDGIIICRCRTDAGQ